MNSEDHIRQDEITLKELILKVREYAFEVFKYWWVIGLLCLFTSSCFLYKHFTHIPTYTAELRFVVEGQGGVGGGLGGILGSFGIKKNGSVNPFKILEVGKSNKLFEDIAFSGYNADTTIAEKILNTYDLVEKWSQRNIEFEDFSFLNNEMDRPIEKKAFKKLRGLVWGSPDNQDNVLSQLSLNEEKGIYSLTSSTTDEGLSIVMTNKLYKGIKAFFEDEVFENQKRSAEILAAKADSINTLQTAKIYELSRFEDRNQSLVFKESASRKAILSQEIQALGMAYSELMKNYELTDINLRDMQPLFMEIDRPFSPITPSSSSLSKNLLIGLFLGMFLGTIIIVLMKIFKDIMN